MKQGQIIKSRKEYDEVQEMALVNQYTRRELSEDEVYLFSVVICDNEIDRDYEMFPLSSLETLSKLFVGKTGIFDHDPSAKNQKARIISCTVEKDDKRKNAVGDPYCRLVCRAYIPKNEENLSLIDAIDAGILKEVSVGCSIRKTVCSVCGEDIHSPLCAHRKGEIYNKELCFGMLEEPTDAYEFSFVAVPAQRNAGVIKSLRKRKEISMHDKLKNVRTGESVTLSYDECEALKSYLSKLENSAADAEAYKEQMKKELVKKLSPCFSGLSAKTAKEITDLLSASQMRELCAGFSVSEKSVPKPMLASDAERRESFGMTQFTIE